MPKQSSSQRESSSNSSSSNSSSNNNNNNMSNKTTIRVVAPATLEEGFTFDVLLQGEPYTVTVPPGGVEQGEEFDIPYPSMLRKEDNEGMNDDEDDQNGDDMQQQRQRDNDKDNSKGRRRKQRLPKMESILSTNSNNNHNSNNNRDLLGAPMGRWRYPVYACCDVLTQATFWMACFCTPVLLAQLVTRLRLNWKGNVNHGDNNDSDDDEASLSFNRIVLSFVAVLVAGQFFPGLGLVLTGIYMLVLLVWIGGNVRRTVRRRYRIPPSLLQCNNNNNNNSNNNCGCCCNNNNSSNTNTNTTTPYYERIEDGLCMCFCGTCALIQMARQTHNDKEYPGLCCTTTGLELRAPEIPYLLESASTESAN